MGVASIYSMRSGIAAFMIPTLLVEGMNAIDIPINRIAMLNSCVVGPEGLSEVLPKMEVMYVLGYKWC
jgi:hypothetical protein